MNKLLDDENEEDEAFWNQDALKEEENDDNYEEEQEIADEFDSDFDEDEPEPDEEGENEVDERVRTKKRLIFPGKPLTKKKKKKKILSKLDSPDKDVKSNEQSILPENHDVPNDVEGERIIRKSTRTAVVVRQAERDAIRAALQATMKPIKRKKEGEEKRITQEEMLLEAAQTEIMNLRNLERVLAREEEVKKRAIVHKAVYTGPQLRYLSKDGYSYLEFSKGVSFQSELSTTSVPLLTDLFLNYVSVIPVIAFSILKIMAALNPERAVCAVTGLPAKYRDPKTGLPYATKEAFKIIRERFVDESSGIRKAMDMGTLFDSLSRKGFMATRRRSKSSNKNEKSYLRYSARFRRFPSLEIEVSD
ncbi:SWR1 complex subunit 2 [Citrus sinensis]|uniref:SWR1 complex subunit 2 n=1 Tax=Citrus sinensis TaxID=2711 RepID=A0ACB8JR05_CITSI|nr:SWR1 complex subunit 2 [Citrus sinensis]